VHRLNLDAASFRQLSEHNRQDPDAVRAEVLDIVATRGKMHNPVTGSGGMLLGTVDEVGPESPLGLAVGDSVASPARRSPSPTASARGTAGPNRSRVKASRCCSLARSRPECRPTWPRRWRLPSSTSAAPRP